jgi:hypothetical protein
MRGRGGGGVSRSEAQCSPDEYYSNTASSIVLVIVL